LTLDARSKQSQTATGFFLDLPLHLNMISDNQPLSTGA
jgi:hypothetical protein